jgi:hypothetical protein
MLRNQFRAQASYTLLCLIVHTLCVVVLLKQLFFKCTSFWNKGNYNCSFQTYRKYCQSSSPPFPDTIRYSATVFWNHLGGLLKLITREYFVETPQLLLFNDIPHRLTQLLVPLGSFNPFLSSYITRAELVVMNSWSQTVYGINRLLLKT